MVPIADAPVADGAVTSGFATGGNYANSTLLMAQMRMLGRAFGTVGLEQRVILLTQANTSEVTSALLLIGHFGKVQALT